MPIYYTDPCCQNICSEISLLPEELIVSLFAHPPGWIKGLLEVRNVLVKPFGIKTQKPDIKRLILAQKEQEAIWGMDERHLQFYVSLEIIPLEKTLRQVKMITLVKYHNKSGKLYFFFIRPFHRMIVPVMLKQILHPYSKTTTYKRKSGHSLHA